MELEDAADLSSAGDAVRVRLPVALLKNRVRGVMVARRIWDAGARFESDVFYCRIGGNW